MIRMERSKRHRSRRSPWVTVYGRGGRRTIDSRHSSKRSAIRAADQWARSGLVGEIGFDSGPDESLT